MTIPRLRVGLVGLGAMGRHHARTLAAIEGVAFVGVADPHADTAALAGVGGISVHESVSELLERRLDYCVVAVPTSLHYSVAMEVAAAGVHMLVEKPVAASSVEALRMADEFDRRGLIGAVGHIERFNPALQQLRRRLDAGELGMVFQVATRRQGPFPLRVADVGVVIDLATHDIDITRYLTNREYATVSAQLAHLSGRSYEDMLAATCRLEGGIVVNHLVNWICPIKERVTSVIGERGMYTASTLNGDLTFAANGTAVTEWDGLAHFRGVSEGDVVSFAYPKREPLRLEHEEFVRVLSESGGEFVSLREGARTLAVGERLLEAARLGRSLDIDH